MKDIKTILKKDIQFKLKLKSQQLDNDPLFNAVIPYLKKKILCFNDVDIESGLKKSGEIHTSGKFYEIAHISIDVENGYLDDDNFYEEYSIKDYQENNNLNILKQITLVDNYNHYTYHSLDSFYKYFKLKTKEDIRRDKIKNILK